MRISDWSSDVCSSDLGRKITFAGVGQGGEEYRTLRRGLRDLQRGRHGGTGGDADQEAFLGGEPTGGVARSDVVNRADVIDHVAVQYRGHEVRRPSLDLVRLPFLDRKSTRLHSSHSCASRMPSSA